MEFKGVRNRIPFLLKAGERLRAASNFRLYVPGTILVPPGTPISELILLSNQNADIGLLEMPEAPGKVSAIIVTMNVGDEISLGRSTEVVIDGLESDAQAFV